MLKADDTALVLIDVQGRLAQLMHERERLFRKLEVLLRGARVLELPILWLEQYPEGLGPTVPQVAALLEGLAPIAKTCFSACGSPDFRQALAATGRRSLLLCGIEAHVCVYQTGRDLLADGCQVEVVTDAVSSRTEADYRLGVERLAACGAHLTGVEMALFELLREAGAARFKEISKLVK